MFRKAATNMFTKMQLKEANRFMEMLRAVDSSELGLVVAIATHFRNEWMDKGIDVSHPIQTHALDPNLVVNLLAEIKELQRSGGEVLASGMMVWVFSLRAGNDLKLRTAARQIWGQLERGFPYVEQAALDARLFLPSDLDIRNYNQFPDGLTPEPI